MEENKKLPNPHPEENKPKEIPNVNGTIETVMSQTNPAAQ